jgi:hypothetical protein
MAAQQRPDDLAQLRAEFAARFAAQDTEIARLKRHRRLPRRALPLLLATFLVALVPLATLAANPFIDLVPGSVHNANIDAIYNAGITTGCVPNAEYCPTDLVTRQEMASFLARTAGLGSNPPVANAATAVNAVNAQSAVNAQNATSAGNADTLDGYDANGLVRVARGTGGTALITATLGGTAQYQTGASLTLAVPGPGFVLVTGASTAATASTTCNGSNGGRACTFAARLRDTGAGGSASPYLTTVVTATANFADSLTPTYVSPVIAAGERTFVLEVATDSSYQNHVILLQSQITALFVPFGSGGAGTLGTDAPTGPQPAPIVVP